MTFKYPPLGHWGGVVYARQSLEFGRGHETEKSILRHVEIVGGGQAHNRSIYSAALQVIGRSPILENVNVTNSSMGGIQVGFFIHTARNRCFRLSHHNQT